MNDGAVSDPLQQAELAFFGSVTASLSHQINNVFSIVSELDGLIEDLLVAAEHGRPIPPERLKAATEKIARNVERGTEYVRLLSRFAHAADHPQTDSDLSDLVRLFDALSRRFLELKRARMEVSLPSSDPVPIRTNPFRLLHALFLCLQAALEAGGESRIVSLGLQVEKERLILNLQSADPIPRGASLEQTLSLLGRLAEALGGSASFVSERGASRFDITLPAQHPSTTG